MTKRKLLHSNSQLAENRHVMCVVEKAGFEPRTLGTGAERATNCATAPVEVHDTSQVWSGWTASSFSITFAILQYWQAPQCPSANSLSGHQHIAHDSAKQRQLTATSAPSLLQKSMETQHLTIVCLSTYKNILVCTSTYCIHTYLCLAIRAEQVLILTCKLVHHLHYV
jgi:hypothetical protein